jgi:hypothetical protein
MEIELRALLLADSGVSGLVGRGVNWGEQPQHQGFPSIVLHLIGGGEGYTLDGADGVNRGRVQVDCYALEYEDAKAVSEAVNDVLSGYSGGGFQGIFAAGVRADRIGGSNEAESPFRRSLDFTFTFTN